MIAFLAIMGRLLSLCMTAGIACTHLLPSLIPWRYLFVAGLVLLVCPQTLSSSRGQRLAKIPLLICAVFTLGMCWSNYRAQIRLDDHLAESLDNYVTRLNIQITSMIQDDDLGMRFDARVLDRSAGVPSRIQVNWPRTILVDDDSPDKGSSLRPGQVWRAALLLKRPHGLMNPHGFDYESLMFQRGIRAVGKVRGRPVLLENPAGFSGIIFVEQLRQTIRERMRTALSGARYGPVLIALAIGDQNSVSSADWRIFNLTGITHLVSISGSHVTMMAALGASLVLWLVKRIKLGNHTMCEFIPARKIAIVCAVILAWLYCLLAGWGVPAQRTFFMLCAMACCQLSNFAPSLTRVLCVAALTVSAIDPWSTITTGFWLSFGAVAVLFYLGSHSGFERSSSKLQEHTFQDSFRRGAQFIFDACKLQWLISVALCPVLIFLFQQFSASSLFANAVAIPVVSLIVTPLALASALLVLMPGGAFIANCCLQVAHFSFNWMMVPVGAAADFEWLVFDFPAVPIWTVVLAIFGLIWGLAPCGTPSKAIAWLCFFPLFLYKPSRPDIGDWTLTVADVGQAGAALLQTHRHDILFDTGLKIGEHDSAQRVLLPMLRSKGIRVLDHVIVSHSDSDHAGGLLSLLKGISVKRISSSFDLLTFVSRHDKQELLTLDPGMTDLCRAGQIWHIDEVTFEFVHPSPLILAQSQQRPAKSNALSCVLRIQGAHHSALMPGDISEAQEQSILTQQDIHSDIIIMPHHGSRTSSSWDFVQQVSATHAIAQVGRHNRFNHPDLEVVGRWRNSGSQVWRTDFDGAVIVKSQRSGLTAAGSRQTGVRYWHQR